MQANHHVQKAIEDTQPCVVSYPNFSDATRSSADVVCPFFVFFLCNSLRLLLSYFLSFSSEEKQSQRSPTHHYLMMTQIYHVAVASLDTPPNLTTGSARSYVELHSLNRNCPTNSKSDIQ